MMDILSGSSFYDVINKFIVGFLILLPWIPDYNMSRSYSMLLLGISCWIIGLYFWGIVDKYFNSISPKKQYHDKQYDGMIRAIYWAVLNEIKIKLIDESGNEVRNITKYDYYKAYYTIQERGLLGPVKVLEGFSAFFRNFAFILIYWCAIDIISTLLSGDFYLGPIWVNWYLIKVDYCIGKLVLLILTVIVAVEGIKLSVCLRTYIESIIVKSVLLTYILTQNRYQKS